MQACGLKHGLRKQIDIMVRSRLMQACGLKLCPDLLHKIIFHVTPHAGVWIETFVGGGGGNLIVVTPHAGVWIETSIDRKQTCRVRHVTPHAGVWIETRRTVTVNWSSPSRLMQACGLKLNSLSIRNPPSIVTPHAGVWIETPLCRCVAFWY